MSDSVRVRDIFHDLMPRKIRKILLVCRPYDAFILEQGGSLSSRIASEYHGLNLSNPPRLTRVSSGTDALAHLSKNPFDLVITMPTLDDMDCVALGRNIKQREPDLPVILLAHNVRDIDIIQRQRKGKAIDRFYIWSANPDFLMALVKNIEDHLNARNDTSVAMVRVLLLVEDSPLYLSSFLPLIYKEVVKQTQAVLDESLNGEDRLLKMRARPKILLAGSYEEAEELLRIYEPFLLGVMSDTKFPRHGRLNKIAGIALLRHIRKEIHDLPLLLLSADSENRQQAEKIPAVFQDKNAADLLDGIRNFFLNHLGFGDFSCL
jgi:CheY-like chemotaxis protein